MSKARGGAAISRSKPNLMSQFPQGAVSIKINALTDRIAEIDKDINSVHLSILEANGERNIPGTSNASIDKAIVMSAQTIKRLQKQRAILVRTRDRLRRENLKGI